MKNQKGLLPALLLAATLLFCACMPASVAGPGEVDPASDSVAEPTLHTVHFSAVGDNLIHGSLFLQAAQRANEGGGAIDYDFTYLYQEIEGFLSRYDLNYINQETLINDQYAPSHYPNFSSPAILGDHLYDIGFRVFSMANNHTYDKLAGGISATRAFWASMPDSVLTTGLWTGEDYNQIPIYEINGITIAFLAYTDHTNGIPTPAGAEAHVIYTSQEDIIEQQVRLANDQADLVVVCPHWGVENSHTVSDQQRQLAQKMVDWGADLILGTHPHVLQEIAMLENADEGTQVPVIYSLGNFVSAQSQPDQLVGGFMTMDFLKEGEEGTARIENVQFHPVVTHYGAGYSNVKAYLLADYTPELAAVHGVRRTHSYFSYDYIVSMIRENIDEQYLVWKESA